ncbi:MAG: hypothetical protein ACXVCY_04685 [Pseudobdellovibrionaceae bacterium]
MKNLILCGLFLIATSQAFAFESDKNAVQPTNKNKGISSSSGSLFKDVECDMNDYTCQKLILDLGQQEALVQLANPNESLSEILVQAIALYKSKVKTAANLTDDEVIQLLAAAK